MEARDDGLDLTGCYFGETLGVDLLVSQAESFPLGFAQGVIPDDVNAPAVLKASLQGNNASQMVVTQVYGGNERATQDGLGAFTVDAPQVLEGAVVRHADVRLMALRVGLLVVEQEEVHERDDL